MSKILVAYATRAGSTAEVAEEIGATLRANGATVDVRAIKSVRDVNGYDAAIIGSAIRMGSWLPEMVDFIKANQASLNAIPIALFTVHILNTGEDEASRAAQQAYLNPIRLLVKPTDDVFFSGKIALEPLSFVDRLMVKMVNPPVGDYRDWDKIRAWSSAVFQ